MLFVFHLKNIPSSAPSKLTKSPVKLQDFSYSGENQSEDLVIHRMTTATPVSEVLFPITEELQKNAPITIASLQKLAPEQLVDFKAEVCAVSAMEKVIFQGKDPLRKQEVVLRDEIASVKLVLWGDCVDTLDVKVTYNFENLRLKVGRTERYLNTPKSGEFKAHPSTPFQNALAEFEDLPATTVFTQCKLLGVQQCNRKVACISCFKKVIPDEESENILSQVIQQCPVIWTMRLLVQTKDNNKLRLTFHHQEIQQLISIAKPYYKIDASTTEKDIKISLLSGGKQFNIMYDTVEFKVLSVEK